MEHERGPLGGREPVEHQGESELDLVIERDPVGGVDGLLTEDRLDTLP